MSGDVERAVKVAVEERLVQQRPMSGVAWADLGEAYAEMGQHELAVTALRRAIELGPTAWAWHCLSLSLAGAGEDGPALEAARKAVALAPEAPLGLVNLGRRLTLLDRPREAVRHLEKAVRLDQGAPRTMGFLGIARCDAGDYGGAAECLEEAVRADPDQPVFWAYLGVSLDELGRRESAVFALETAVFALPDYAWAWGRLGKALRGLGRHEEALRAFEKAVELGFAPPVLWSDMGDSAAEVRDVARVRRACRELGRLEAALAKPLRRRLRSLVGARGRRATPRPGAGHPRLRCCPARTARG